MAAAGMKTHSQMLLGMVTYMSFSGHAKMAAVDVGLRNVHHKNCTDKVEII